MVAPPISVYIIAYNEAEKLSAAINSVLWADEILVADSHSTDDTAVIAQALGARVIQIDFNGFGDLRNQAMAACTHDWVFSLDSDERCTTESKDEIIATITQANTLDAYYIPRRNFFMGKWIKYSGFYPDYRQPQLFRKGALHFKNDPVHEAYTVTSNRPLGYLKKSIWQMPYKNLSEIQHKANKYSSLGAEKLAMSGRRSSMDKAFWHAVWAFFSLYVLKLGFLDGWAGFVIALGNFEGTFYKYAKLYEKNSDWQFPCAPPIIR